MELTTKIHNNILQVVVVYDVKDTKFEWNSQHSIKIHPHFKRLFMMSKIQNLNGTHNDFSTPCGQ